MTELEESSSAKTTNLRGFHDVVEEEEIQTIQHVRDFTFDWIHGRICGFLPNICVTVLLLVLTAGIFGKIETARELIEGSTGFRCT